VDLPALEHVGAEFCKQNTILTTLNLPNLITMDQQCFWGTKLTVYDFPNLTTITNGLYVFGFLTNATLINIPNCTQLGETTGNNNAFVNLKTNCVINIDASIETADGGNRDGDIVYAEDTRSATINYI
jgi:hypothetical protein